MAEPLPVLYLAGPMSGLPAYNYPAFDAAAARLRAAGFEVLNPAENVAPENAEWSDWMRLSLGQLVRAGGVARLPGAEGSRGARLEMKLAGDLGMKVQPVPAWLTQQGQDAYMARLLGTNETSEENENDNGEN
jgi:hypothetical protein